jgi:predicted metal-binding membrane protein
MLLAFALGAGSIAIMAAITMVMVWEACARRGVTTVKLIGYALIAIGVMVMAGPVIGPSLWLN